MFEEPVWDTDNYIGKMIETAFHSDRSRHKKNKKDKVNVTDAPFVNKEQHHVSSIEISNTNSNSKATKTKGKKSKNKYKQKVISSEDIGSKSCKPLNKVKPNIGVNISNVEADQTIFNNAGTNNNSENLNIKNSKEITPENHLKLENIKRRKSDVIDSISPKKKKFKTDHCMDIDETSNIIASNKNVKPKKKKTISADSKPSSDNLCRKISISKIQNKFVEEKNIKSNVDNSLENEEKKITKVHKNNSFQATPADNLCQKNDLSNFKKLNAKKLSAKKLQSVFDKNSIAYQKKDKPLMKKTFQPKVTEEDDIVNLKHDSNTPSLKERMLSQLNSARFRYLNESLYTTSSDEALKLFQDDEDAFKVYHDGFSNQVSKWPVNPVDLMITYIKKKSTNLVVADLGCGDAKIARSVKNKNVHSFDLVALNKFVTVCDMTNVHMNSGSVDIAVCCLSLMGINFIECLIEANRILKKNGTLLIAEVVSRFDKVSQFIRKMDKLGFLLIKKDDTNKMFLWFEFRKVNVPPPIEKIPKIELAPCFYKKR